VGQGRAKSLLSLFKFSKNLGIKYFNHFSVF
jgi:hypothetical protein